MSRGERGAIPIVLVLARADNGVIGRGGGLPWRLPRDLARYKRITMGCPMVMGRKTWDSIGRPLPGRESIVVTRDPAYVAPGAHVVPDLAGGLDLARSLAARGGAHGIIIAGGAEIYRAALPLADRIELTEVHMAAAGDTRLDAFPGPGWREIARRDHRADGEETADFSFVTLVRDAAP